MGEELLLKKEEGKATITFNRPEKFNAFTLQMIEDLTRMLDELGRDSETKFVILMGGGGNAFCAGTDINVLAGLKSRDDAARFIDMVHKMCSTIEELPKVVIAVIDGYCLGLGCEIAMSCDLRMASDDSKFGQPESKLGILPGAGGTQRMTRLLGVGKAKELMYTGATVDQAEALRIGLVNLVVEKAALREGVGELVHKLSVPSYNAILNIKKDVNDSFKLDGYELEKEMFLKCFDHADRAEGVDAFLQRRKANFA